MYAHIKEAQDIGASSGGDHNLIGLNAGDELPGMTLIPGIHFLTNREEPLYG